MDEIAEAEFRAEVRQWVRDYYLGEWRMLPEPKRPAVTFAGLALLLVGVGVGIIRLVVVSWPVPSPAFVVWRNPFLIVVIAPSVFLLAPRLVDWVRERVLQRWVERAERLADAHMAKLPALDAFRVADLKVLMNLSCCCSREPLVNEVRERGGMEDEFARWSFLQELYRRWCL
ncbi:hypothetical protein HYW67_02290 [Candidatus Parcubacteria bacterium]|nr:hypothetical protein [Candidatus Parcubacteria bacterium]